MTKWTPAARQKEATKTNNEKIDGLAGRKVEFTTFLCLLISERTPMVQEQLLYEVNFWR